MNRPVFISYSRAASEIQARELYEALGGDNGPAFFDRTGIAQGMSVPDVLLSALLQARVVVIFASEQYFQRWYCLWELRTTLRPFIELASSPGEDEKRAALEHILVVRLSGGAKQGYLSSLPHALRNVNWPTAEDLPKLAGLVLEKLAASRKTLEERLGKGKGRSRLGLTLELKSLEPHCEPRDLAGERNVYPPELEARSRECTFVGRVDELYWLHFHLSVLRDMRGAGGASLDAGIYAAPGFGKTELAWQYFRRYGPDHYPGGLLWVDAGRGEDGLTAQFYDIIKKLQGTRKVGGLKAFRESRLDAAKVLREVLEPIAREQRILFVVDNVPEPPPGGGPEPWLTWCPAHGHVSLLLISHARQHEPGGDFHVLNLSTLRTEASVALLTEPPLDETLLKKEEWEKIAEWVGNLPLALKVLRYAMWKNVISPKALLSLARSKRGSVKSLHALVSGYEARLPRDVSRGLAAFSLPYAKLSSRARRSARLVARLAQRPVPSMVLETFGAGKSSPVVQMELTGLHFLTVSSSHAWGQMLGGMHPLIASYVRERSYLPVSEVRQVGRGLTHLLVGREPSGRSSRISGAIGERYEDAGLPLEACMLHAEHILEQLIRADASTLLERLQMRLGLRLTELKESALLGEALVASSLERGMFRLASRVGTLLLSLDAADPYMLRFKGLLSKVLRRMGELKKAETLQKELLDVRLRMGGEAHRDTLLASMEFAVTRLRMGMLSQARLELVCEKMEEEWGAEQLVTIKAMSYLGESLRQAGELDKARALQERVLEYLPAALDAERAYQERLPKEQRRNWVEEELEEILDMSGARAGLALTLKEQGHLKEALRLERRVLKARREELGKEHPDTLVAYGHVAETLRLMGRPRRARWLQSRVLRGRRRELGAEHPDTLRASDQLAVTLRDLAVALRRKGMLARVRRMQEQVLRGERRIWGEEHPRALEALARLAATLRAQGELGRALALQKEELELRSRVYEAMDRRRCQALLELSITLREQGALEEAQARQEELLQRVFEQMGRVHPDTLLVKRELASTFRERNRLVEAIAHQREVLMAMRQSLGQESPHVLDAMSELALTLFKQGEYGEARLLQERVLEVRRRVLGEESQATLAVMSQLAHTCHYQEAYQRALELRLSVWKMRQLVARRDDELWREAVSDVTMTFAAMDRLAVALRNYMRPREAHAVLVPMVEAMQLVLGEEHPETLAAKFALAGARLELGDFPGFQALGGQVEAAVLRLMGDGRLDTLTAKVKLAVALGHGSIIGLAKPLLESVVETMQRVLGETHPDTLSAKVQLAWIMQRPFATEEARVLLESVVKAMRWTYGEEHQETLAAKAQLAMALRSLRDGEGARILLESVVGTMHRVLGETHHDTLAAKSQLAMVLRELGDDE